MDKRNLSDRYTDLRIEKGLSQTELAAALDCNKQYISKFEDGSRKLSLAMLEKYADFFGVSTDYLLGRTDVKTVNADLAAACEYTGLSEDVIEKLHAIKTKQYSRGEKVIIENGIAERAIPDPSINNKLLLIINHFFSSKSFNDFIMQIMIYQEKFIDTDYYIENRDSIKSERTLINARRDLKELGYSVIENELFDKMLKEHIISILRKIVDDILIDEQKGT